MTIEHNGQRLDIIVHGKPEGDGYHEPRTIDELWFEIEGVDDRDPTAEEKERLDEELTARMDTDIKWAERVSLIVTEAFDDHWID